MGKEIKEDRLKTLHRILANGRTMQENAIREMEELLGKKCTCIKCDPLRIQEFMDNIGGVPLIDKDGGKPLMPEKPEGRVPFVGLRKDILQKMAMDRADREALGLELAKIRLETARLIRKNAELQKIFETADKAEDIAPRVTLTEIVEILYKKLGLE